MVLNKHQFGATAEDEYKPYAFLQSASSSSVKNIKSDWLGVGTEKTWHGYTNAQFRIDGSNDVTLLSHDDNSEGSPRNSIAIEAKLQISANKLMQLVPTSVVEAFVEMNLHSDLSPVIPTILIVPIKALICMYDVQQDFLSDMFQWIDKVGDNKYLTKLDFFVMDDNESQVKYLRCASFGYRCI